MSTGTGKQELTRAEQEKHDELVAQILDNHRMLHRYLPVVVKRDEEGIITYEGKLSSNLFNDYSNVERLTLHYLEWQDILKEGNAPSCICQEYAAKVLSDKITGGQCAGRAEAYLRRMLAA
jgi:hypothetical protein